MSINTKIIGNNPIQKRFSHLLCEERLSHAYIFHGPRSLGKRTFAEKIAQQLLGNTQEENKQPYRYITPGEKRSIEVEVIRALRREAQLGFGRKVFIIDEAHRMTVMAQNALLKILEEPRENIVFIFITDAVGELLPTVYSRCEKVCFQRVNLCDFSSVFSSEEWKEYEVIARMAFGKPGIFFSLLHNEEEQKKRKTFFQIFMSFEKRKMYEVMRFAQNLHNQPEKIQGFLEYWIEYYRYTCREGRISYKKAYTQIEKIHKTIWLIHKTNASPRLLLESLFLSLIE